MGANAGRVPRKLVEPGQSSYSARFTIYLGFLRLTSFWHTLCYARPRDSLQVGAPKPAKELASETNTIVTEQLSSGNSSCLTMIGMSY
jgi:hypothetical protein